MASIRKRGNSYQIIVSNGRDQTGKQIIETTTFVPDPGKTMRQNQKVLDRFVIEFEDKVKGGRYLGGEKLTYAAYIKIWLKDYAYRQMEQTSVERCEIALSHHILPALGHLKLAKIRPLHIQKLYDDLIEKGYSRNGKHCSYSNNTIKRTHQVISSTLNTAVYWQLIESNPCSRVKPPKVEKAVDVKHFTLEQAQIFLDQMEKPYLTAHGGRRKKDGSSSVKLYDTKEIPEKYKVFFHMALFGGFRRGELLALTWDDIDFANNAVSVTKALVKTKKDGVTIKQPKTHSSIRIVTLPDDTMKRMMYYKMQQDTLRREMGPEGQDSNYLFVQSNGMPMDVATPNKVFQKIIRRYNETAAEGEKLPEITLHGLRHTSATLLISQNIDIKTVSGRLGHADTSTTMNIYAHALQKADEKAAVSIGKLFQKK